MQTALADERWFKWSYVVEADAAAEWASAVFQFRMGKIYLWNSIHDLESLDSPPDGGEFVPVGSI